MPKKKSSREPTENEVEMEVSESDGRSTSGVYLPGQPLEEGEELVCDESAYIMLHQAQTGSPCLSFDIIRDDLGDNRQNFPLSAYIVAGTQADRAHTNSLFVLKMSNMMKTQKLDKSDDESDEDSDDEEEVEKPKMDFARIKHQGCVNRIRSTVYGGSVIAATWSELGRVNIWDLKKQLQAVDDPNLLTKYKADGLETSTKPLFMFAGHTLEGFALDWCPTSLGTLASGDCKRDIHVWHPLEAGSWNVDQRPLVGHTDSVEDLQWSPNERHVLASCSVDKSLRIWDVRASSAKANMLTVADAHTSDVNVISWNRNEPFICSGGDDGVLKVWDLRRLSDADSAVVTFKHHSAELTSVEWHPAEPTVFASAGADDQIALWDLSLERDDDPHEDQELPPQLLFIHQGQKDLKELHWHPQIPGVVISTALSGFNIFRTISI